MADSLGKAIHHCEDLAVHPLKGPIYHQYRTELKLVEGCCRQASAWREDTRWLPIGLMMSKCHNMAGEWLRGVQDPVTKRRTPIPEGQKHPLFVKLAENLRALLVQVEKLRTGATGKMGMILPVTAPAPFRDTRQHRVAALPPGMTQRPSGLIVPGMQ
jgi:hypothetical protein